MSIDAKGISQFAKTFIIAAKRCEEKVLLPNGKYEIALIPGLVCRVFSVELSFKAIIKAKGGNGRGHKLEKLFKEIPEAERSLIIKETSLSESQFYEKLCAVSNAFVDWRYIYEKGQENLDYKFLTDLAGAVQKVSASLVECKIE